MYTSITNTIECTKVIVDTEQKDFVSFKFYQGRNLVLTTHASASSDKEFEFFKPIEAHDVTILLEETDATADTAISA